MYGLKVLYIIASKDEPLYIIKRRRPIMRLFKGQALNIEKRRRREGQRRKSARRSRSQKISPPLSGSMRGEVSTSMRLYASLPARLVDR
jgi:hypothetical protein